MEGKAVSNSSGEAKVVATASARRDALNTLFSRLSANQNIAGNLNNDEIFDLVSSEQIVEEKISGNGYSAIFNITFSKGAVERALNSGKKIEKEDRYLLIPVKMLKPNLAAQNQSKFLLWEENNDWKIAIENQVKNESIKNFIIPESDLSNIAALNKDNIDQVSFSDLEPLLTKYKIDAALILFFSYDDIENKVVISVQNIKKLQKKRFKLSFVNVDRLSYDALVKKVADKTVEFLLQNKSNDNSNAQNIIKIEVPITSLGSWITVKNKIENSNLVNQLNIEVMSKDYVKISVNYIGDDLDIVKAFADKNIYLEKKSEDLFLISEK
ncbi:MAG: DUF2066 domain-containing protein [Rickettsiales bacterium]|nr:DUF2066 domain-containing protein [Rickettsiales bacterium]